MIPGVRLAGHTGHLVIEPVGSTDNAAAVWLRCRERPADCVWMTASQLRQLSRLADETADWLTANAPYVAAITARVDPPPEPSPSPTWWARLRTALSPTGDL